MLRRYIDSALIYDLIILSILCIVGYFFREQIAIMINISKSSDFGTLSEMLVTVSSTMVGFLLTIVTVIMTFKNSYNTEQSKPKDQDGFSIFDKIITKESQFYDGKIYKRVLNVFLKATYEIVVLILILILLKSGIVTLGPYRQFIVHILLIVALFMAVLRCLFIFKLFLRVHED